MHRVIWTSRAWRRRLMSCPRPDGTASAQADTPSIALALRCLSAQSAAVHLSPEYNRICRSTSGPLRPWLSATLLSLRASAYLPRHTGRFASSVIQFPLAQTGEGIKECELTEWFVEVRAVSTRACYAARQQNSCRFLFSMASSRRSCWLQKGSRVEEFQKICEVQSDKAAVEITSRYAGVIKQLHHSPGDVVQVHQACHKHLMV